VLLVGVVASTYTVFAQVPDRPPADVTAQQDRDQEMHDGTRIRTAEQWWAERRPEMLAGVEETVWGRMPNASVLPKVTGRT
jgi:hypothetical protein